jgi:hypothetical protein
LVLVHVSVALKAFTNSFIDRVIFKFYSNLAVTCIWDGPESNFVGVLWVPNTSVVTTNTPGDAWV